MLDETKRVAFIRDGLRHYADARDTVDAFQNLVIEAVQAAFEAKTGWKNFQPLRAADGTLEFGRGIGPTDRYIQGWIAGRVPLTSIPGKTWLSLGLYWKPGRRPNTPVVAACHAWADRATVPLIDIPSRNERIQLGPLFRRSERRLFLEPFEDFDLGEAFGLLLDAADDALAATDPADSETINQP